MRPRFYWLPCLGLLFLGFAISHAQTPQAAPRASLENYLKAWQEPDAQRRQDLLQSSWSEKGTYTDPTAHVVGRQALVEHIGQFLSNPQFKNSSFAQASEIDVHHSAFRFEWKLLDAKGNELMTGMDYGEFNEHGQITKIVGFFGPFPKLK